MKRTKRKKALMFFKNCIVDFGNYPLARTRWKMEKAAILTLAQHVDSIDAAFSHVGEVIEQKHEDKKEWL